MGNVDRYNYIVLCEAGHVSGMHAFLTEERKMDYSMPILQIITADSEAEAIRKAAEIPRVSHYAKHSVRYCKKASLMECLLVSFINEFDEYLTESSSKGSHEDIEARLITPRRYIDALEDEYTKTGKHMYVDKLNLIKTADKFSDLYPLQQYLSPVWDDGNLVFPKKDFDETLARFFTIMTQKVAMTEIKDFSYLTELRKRVNNENLSNEDLNNLNQFDQLMAKRVVVLMAYLKLFGKNNPLRVVYKSDKHQMTYIASPRETLSLPKRTSINQITTFFNAIFGDKNPLNLEYDKQTHSISYDAQKLKCKVDCENINLVRLYKDLFSEKVTNPKTGKQQTKYHDPLRVCSSYGYVPSDSFDKPFSKDKPLNLQNIYNQLFMQINPKTKRTFDPLRAHFDAKNGTITFHLGHLIEVNIPDIKLDEMMGRPVTKDSKSIEQFFMGTKEEPNKNKPIYAKYFSQEEASDEDNFENYKDQNATVKIPSAVEKFNARLAKTKSMQDGKQK